MIITPSMNLACACLTPSNSSSFTFSTSMDSYCLKKSDFISRLAILIASTPRLAPRVPAPISDFTSMIFNVFTVKKIKVCNGFVWREQALKGYRIVRGQARRGSRSISGRKSAEENDLPCNLNVLQRWQIYLNIALLSRAQTGQHWQTWVGNAKEKKASNCIIIRVKPTKNRARTR